MMSSVHVRDPGRRRPFRWLQGDATIGSTRVARRAGATQAITDTPSNTALAEGQDPRIPGHFEQQRRQPARGDEKIRRSPASVR